MYDEEQTFVLACPRKGHELRIDATAMEDWLYDFDFLCPVCWESKRRTKLELIDGDLRLECVVCDEVVEAHDFEEASSVLSEGCGPCFDRGFGSGYLHFRGSWGYHYAIYDWTRNGRSCDGLTREGRTDYWEGVVHFCKPDEFVSIYRQRKIKASPTGYFGVPAVCLTEATRENWNELQATHGGFGFIFKKRDILAAAGGPALYMTEDQIACQRRLGFAKEVKPFVQLLRIPSIWKGKKRSDWLHEREWRVPADIDLDVITPYAVVIADYRPSRDWKAVIEAAREFEELHSIR